MPYLDKTGLTELWSNIKANFGHYMQSTTSDAGAVIKLYSGSNGTLGTDVKIPPATDTTCGIMTGAQASKLASLQTYTAGTNISISGGQISVIGLAKVATSGKYSDLTGTPTIDTDLSNTSTNAVTNKAITTALSGKAAISHTHTKSQITDFPASLKNPSALTIGDVSYDGSAAKSITAGDNVTISSGKISATDTTYSAATTSVAGLMSASDKTKLDGIAEGAEVNNTFIAFFNVTDPQLVKNAVDDNKNVIIIEDRNVYRYCGYNSDNERYLFSLVSAIEEGFLAIRTIGVSTNDGYSQVYYDNYDLYDYANNYAKLTGATFTGAVTLPAISGTTTNDNTAATTAFVQAVVKASGAGVVHYKGAAASTEKLTNYVTGDYWVASATFTLGSQIIESGDMIFANTTATDFVADNFDVVQANITAMTTGEVDNICTLD